MNDAENDTLETFLTHAAEEESALQAIHETFSLDGDLPPLPRMEDENAPD